MFSFGVMPLECTTKLGHSFGTFQFGPTTLGLAAEGIADELIALLLQAFSFFFPLFEADDAGGLVRFDDIHDVLMYK